MNKKEVLEIRKQFSPANCAITKICGCYVDHEKDVRFRFRDAFLSLPEEEEFKYFDIFKKTLSGSIGKNLLPLAFPIEEELSGEKQKLLLALRKSKLEDDELLETFYTKVIDFYSCAENYYIVLIHGMYDVPGRASDGMEMFDASDDVFDFILCSICPVSLSKAGLSYQADSNRMADRVRDWVVEMPDKGFLFPMFTDRSTDVHGVMYYTKKSADLQEGLIEELFGAAVPVPADTQKEIFMELIEESLGEKKDYETVKNIHEVLCDLMEEHKEEPEPLRLDKTAFRKVLEESGADEESITIFENAYDEKVGEKETLLADNITDTRKFQVTAPDLQIKVHPDRTDLIRTRIIDGRKCLVIAVDEHVEVNGVEVSTILGGANE